MFQTLMENTRLHQNAGRAVQGTLPPRPHWPAHWSLYMVPGGHGPQEAAEVSLGWSTPGWICLRPWLSGWLRKWRYAARLCPALSVGTPVRKTAGLLSPEPPSDTGLLAQPSTSVIRGLLIDAARHQKRTPRPTDINQEPKEQSSESPWGFAVGRRGRNENYQTPSWDRASEKKEKSLKGKQSI